MRAIAWLLRVFCYLYHTILSLALLALGSVAVLSHAEHMKLETLPWQGVELNHWLIGLGIAKRQARRRPTPTMRGALGQGHSFIREDSC